MDPKYFTGAWYLDVGRPRTLDDIKALDDIRAFERQGGKPELKLYAYIAGYGLLIDTRELTECPDDMSPEEFSKWAGTWFRCTITGPGRPRPSVSFNYGQSVSAGKRHPSPTDVLFQAADIGREVDGATFESWCEDLDYDQDSVKAMKTYVLECRIAERLKAVCGSQAAYEVLLYNTETL